MYVTYTLHWALSFIRHLLLHARLLKSFDMGIVYTFLLSEVGTYSLY